MSQGGGAAGLTLLGLRKRARVLTTACLVKRTATPAWKLLWTMGRPGGKPRTQVKTQVKTFTENFRSKLRSKLRDPHPIQFL